MKKKLAGWSDYLAVIICLVVSCTGTEITQTQVDDAYKGQPLTNILVIAVTGNEHNRRTYEKKFAARLKSVGVAAVASEESIPMPPDLKLKKEPILDAVAQHGNDAVIITQLISKEKEDVYTRGGRRHRFFSAIRLIRAIQALLRPSAWKPIYTMPKQAVSSGPANPKR